MATGILRHRKLIGEAVRHYRLRARLTQEKLVNGIAQPRLTRLFRITILTANGPLDREIRFSGSLVAANPTGWTATFF
jgi:hypothetical protein